MKRIAALVLALLLTGGGVLAGSTAAVAAGAPAVKAGASSITGTGLVGEPLSATTSGWSPDPVTFEYQWSIGGKAVAGASTSTYTPVAPDAGKRVTVSITGSRPGYSPVSRIATLPGGVLARGSITGTVFEAGSPARVIAAGYVTLYQAWSVTGAYTEPLGYTTITNGAYLLPNVMPGQYTLDFRNSRDDQHAFLGGGTIGSASTALTVSSGRQTTKNFTFSGTGTISGTLTFDGPPPASADYFSVEALSTTGAGDTVAAADGTFTITGLPAGSYTLSVQASNGIDQASIYRTGTYTVSPGGSPAHLSVAAGRTVAGLRFVLKPAPVVSGVVTDASTGQPVPFVLIQATRVSGGSVGYIDGNQTDAEGRFSLTGVEPGSFTLEAVPPLGEGLDPAFFGGSSQASARVFTVKNGDALTGLAVALPAHSD